MRKITWVNKMNYGFILLKCVLIYFVLIVILRLLGKREVGELSIFDLVLLLIIADIASLGIDNDDFFLPSFFCLLIIVVLQKVLAYFLLHHAKYRYWMDGNPSVIVKDGKLLVAHMKKEKYSIDDLISQMRMEHIMDIREIKLAILETNGILSVFRYSQFDEIRLPVVCSGVLVKENFDIVQLDMKHFLQTLERENLILKKILYASYGNHEMIYFYKNNDKEEELTARQIKL